MQIGLLSGFNLILWVLYTGMQWKCLPIPQDAQGKPAIHYTTVYTVFLRRNNSLHTPGYQDRIRRISYHIPSDLVMGRCRRTLITS